MRAAAARSVDAVVTGGRSLDVVLAEEQANVAERDAALLRLMATGALRRHWRLQSWIDQLLDKPLRARDRVITALLAVGLYQLTETRIPDHAAISQTVEAARTLRRPKLAGLVNACLRRFRRENLQSAPAAADEARFDHPAWLIDAIGADWPHDRNAILAANNERAPMWLRINTKKTSVADYAALLEAEGIAAERQPGLEDALCLVEPRPVERLPGFADGDVSVQDGAAQIAARWLLGDRRGRVLDACAAPGGKSGHLLEVGGDDIALTCIDVDEQRLESVEHNLRRLGLDATLVAADASKPRGWWDGAPFDLILLDAPCSASGVIRRHPDIKLLRKADDIDRLRAQQLSILGALWPLLGPGGRLLYVTCSVLAAENDAVIDTFLAATGGAREDDVLPNNNISDLMRKKTRGYQVLPGSAGLDGFYYACLQKVS